MVLGLRDVIKANLESNPPVLINSDSSWITTDTDTCTYNDIESLVKVAVEKYLKENKIEKENSYFKRVM